MEDLGTGAERMVVLDEDVALASAALGQHGDEDVTGSKLPAFLSGVPLSFCSIVMVLLCCSEWP